VPPSDAVAASRPGSSGVAYLPDYAPVAERVRLFYERHPAGRIITELIRKSAREVVFRAAVYRSPEEAEPAATGWACEREGDGDVNTVACLENAETSAVGRALANLGFLAARSRASAEEVAKASRARAEVASIERSIERAKESVASGRTPRAHLVADLDRLLERARHAGARPARIARWRARLLSRERPWTDEELARGEQWLRAWVRRRQG
jgi:hypothetical protein